MNIDTPEVLSELNSLSAAELELLLLTSYYYHFLNKPKNDSQKRIFAQKQGEYDKLMQVCKPEVVMKVQKFYKKYSNRYKDFYGLIYEFCHKNKEYQNLLMLI